MLLGYGLQRRAEFPISAAGLIVTNSATERLNFTTGAEQVVQFSTALTGIQLRARKPTMIEL
jgi:hypothetical protein